MANTRKNYVVECFYDCTVWTHGKVSGNTIVLNGNNRDTVVRLALGNLIRGSYAYRIGKTQPNGNEVAWQTRIIYAGEVISRKDAREKATGNTKRIVRTFDGGIYPLHSRDTVLDVMGNKIFPKTR